MKLMRGALVAVILVSCGLATSPTANAQSIYNELTEFCNGSGPPNTAAAGQCVIPRGIAVDPNSGDVYVADQSNRRIQRFSAWGEIRRTWGWDVVATGPGDDTTAPEDQFEICIPANGDVCQGGLAGSGEGQFSSGIGGIAIDSDGDIFVVDRSNFRVQKFDSAGNFEMMFGRGVNKTKVDAGAPAQLQNRCPVDLEPRDECQAGSAGTGQGEFSSTVSGSFIAIDLAAPGSGPLDAVYVGDVNRIQRFNTAGVYQSEIAVPGTVQSLAVDPVDDSAVADHDGDLFYGLSGQENVSSIDSNGGGVCTLTVERPTAIATSSTGAVHVFSQRQFGNTSSVTWIVQFDMASCTETDRFNAGAAGFTQSTGMATSSACGISSHDLFVSNSLQAESFVRVLGPPPDVAICPPPLVPPRIRDQHALSVGTNGALVRASINPEFWPDTSYYVEYGTGKCSLGGCDQKALFPGSQVGVGTVNKFVTSKGVFLGVDQPLQPDATYHFRFVAQSTGGGPVFGEDPDGAGPGDASFEEGLEGTFKTFPPARPGKVDCPNQDLRESGTGSSAQLPDCRAYEMVSPVDKNNSDIPGAGYDMSAPDGGAFTYWALSSAFADPNGAPFAHQYISERHPVNGWQTRSIAPPMKLPSLYAPAETIQPQYRAFTEDLCSGWLVQETDLALVSGAPAEVPNLYRRSNCGDDDGQFDLITTVPPTEPAPGFSQAQEPNDGRYFLHTQGFSDDGSLTVFHAPAKLTPNAANKDLWQVYAHSDGQLGLVSVLPNGNPASKHASAGTWQSERIAEFRGDSVHNAVASDGSRVFWSESAAVAVPTRGTSWLGDHPGPLYVRLNPMAEPAAFVGTGPSKRCLPEPAKACTLRLSPEPDARFLTAAVDGSRALYSEGDDLFEFDVEKAIAGEVGQIPIAGEVDGVMGASSDISRIYLVSREALDAGATAGEPNLYLYERGIGFRFVATLAEQDTDMTFFPSPINISPKLRTSRVSTDGLHAAFASVASLTGYDNTDANSGMPDSEIFLYAADADEGAGELVCVSCNASGARPQGRFVADPAGPGPILWAASELPGWLSQWQPGRLLAEDGSRLFFESFQGLVPRDSNGRKDIYEWERAVTESQCEEQFGGELYVSESGGCLSLITTGQSDEDSYLLDASEGGRDVFFATSSKLVSEDFGLRDIYDARELGGFAPPPPPQPECEGESCQGTASNPEEVTPASATAAGPGNLSRPSKARRCPKGKRRAVRRGKARCVKRRTAKGAKTKHKRPSAKQRTKIRRLAR